MRSFEIGSAPIDWCERNYVVSGFIAEFFNTISNALFFILPPILIYLFQPYGKKFMQSIHIVWILLVLVGVCSTYFHATLSLAGQLLDELAILWVIIFVFAIWFPKRMLPTFFQCHRNHFKCLIFVIGIISTYLACLEPAINAFVLMCFGLPATILLSLELKRCKCRRVYALGIRSSAVWGLALASWIVDRTLCEPLLADSFPYLHSLWHVLITLATYAVCVLFAYFHAYSEAPARIGIPVLRYWPETARWDAGCVPYVTFVGPADDGGEVEATRSNPAEILEEKGQSRPYSTFPSIWSRPYCKCPGCQLINLASIKRKTDFHSQTVISFSYDKAPNLKLF